MKKATLYVQLLFVLAGLSGYLYTSSVTKGRNRLFLERSDYGQGEQVLPVWVEGLAEEPVCIEVVLKAQQYSEMQIKEIFETTADQLKEQMLLENRKTDEIKSDLYFPPAFKENGVKIRWIPADPELIDPFGKVNNDYLEEDWINTEVTMLLEYGQYKHQEIIPLTVCPKEWNELVLSLLKQIETVAEEHPYEKQVLLPERFQGRELFYRIETEENQEVFLILGIVMALLWYGKEKEDEKKKSQLRQKQLQIDYSEVVFQFMVYIGAGMTIRKAWEQIVKEYEASKKINAKTDRFVYREMSQCWADMNSGVAEAKVYESFGKRCGLQCYIRLSSLLEQSKKTGSSNLRHQLSLEMKDAFELRKQLAKKAGEEAGTKLLMPLFLLLAMVMAIILVPSILTMR